MNRLVKKSLKKGYKLINNGNDNYRTLYAVVSNDNKVRIEERDAMQTFYDEEDDIWREQPIAQLIIYYNKKVVGYICGDGKFSTDAEIFCKQLGA